MLALVMLAILAVLIPNRDASASTVLNAAATTANSSLSACNASQGKALYNCVADVLERMANDVNSIRVGETQRALLTAASQLRAASSKAQALSAITQCQAAIAGALRQVKATPGGKMMVPGWGDHGLASIAGVLARAARMIQAKG
ncbi:MULTISPECIES: hypothetical protein [Bradyrhizobium]|uniref:hypothetical protein n=1 Tax=Bradyrhizobium TaxID=374 RepID=UPI00155EA7CB|nr:MULTISPECIES: hypothetical protein [Bradyrhizobium]MDD1519439.1 hypothetical protein [Bradyrhizobium sp. WBAH30]MDD1543683.1 hypothetical protein [Bradyrhizobium sp. WBAH41]MDD1558032.1 hypothetical protein [Bradyrhizobium sp. WBAH23]MDD1565444.1 hypothetical protein [Bradyrhizobium sp. WBAH33]MDD1592734.1 hypothetical protein [Bradyrhizobium sp. WBAH42]